MDLRCSHQCEECSFGKSTPLLSVLPQNSSTVHSRRSTQNREWGIQYCVDSSSAAQARAHKERSEASTKTAQGFSLRGVSAFNTLFFGRQIRKVHSVLRNRRKSVKRDKSHRISTLNLVWDEPEVLQHFQKAKTSVQAIMQFIILFFALRIASSYATDEPYNHFHAKAPTPLPCPFKSQNAKINYVSLSPSSGRSCSYFAR
jgi:hypothetical protein